MNYFIFIAAIMALGTTYGYMSGGAKKYLKPILDSNVDDLVKQVIRSSYHYVSAFLILATFILFAGSHHSCPLYDYVHHMIRFIALVYLFFAIVQLVVAFTSGIKGGAGKLKQWIFWAVIAILLIIGTM